MMEIDAKGLVPRFLWEDRNGHALAKALEAGLRYFLGRLQEGMSTWHDPEEMPEWRLDEMAWEYNIPYDYKASIEQKRMWVANAYKMSRVYGTPGSVAAFAEGYLGDAVLQEAWEYGGDPFHYKIDLYGNWREARQAWAVTAIEDVSNVRSVLDKIAFHQENDPEANKLYVGIALYGTPMHYLGMTDNPDIENDYLSDELGEYLVDESGVAMTD